MTDEQTVAGWVSCARCSRRARAGQNYCELCGDRLRDRSPPPGHDAEPSTSPTDVPDRRSHHCEQCGARMRVPPDERTTTCAFCGTPYVREGELSSERFAPEFVLPFTVTRRDAEAAYRAWLGRGGLFCPGDFRERGRLEGLRGVYIPFWSFSMRSESSWSADIGEYWWETITETYTTTENGKTVRKTRTRRVRRTEWYPLSGRFHQYHFHYLVSASKGLPQDLADGIQPFPVAEISRYSPHFLSGWLCEEYTVEREDAARISEQEFRDRECRDIAAFLPGDCHSGLRVDTTFHDVTEDLLLLPLWIFAHVYRGRTFRFVLNGSTGACHGKRPVSGAKVALAVTGAILVLLAVVLFFVWIGRGGLR